MAGGRFVLRYRGEGAKPDADVERVRRLPGTVVLDDSSPRLLLVASDEDALGNLVESLAGWVMAPEHSVRVPDTRQRIERPPG